MGNCRDCKHWQRDEPCHPANPLRRCAALDDGGNRERPLAIVSGDYGYEA